MSTEATYEELKEKVIALEKENALLKSKEKKQTKGISAYIRNQKELDFVCPYFREIKNEGWVRASTYEMDFRHIRKAALTAVKKVDANNVFSEQKIKEMSDKDFKLAINCAEELISVISKYKKLYLESVGRDDIIKAFES